MKKTSKIYYLRKDTGLGLVEGRPIKVVDWMDTFIHHDGEVDLWVISEVNTGSMVSYGRTRKLAVGTAVGVLEHVGEDKAVASISKGILAKGGVPSPIDPNISI